LPVKDKNKNDIENLARYLKNEYGELIPKRNLSSLPDFKVVEFIKILQ
jgi:hypothetical protein